MAVKMKDLLENLVKPIVKFPKEVKVTSEKDKEDETVEVLNLNVNPDDIGRVIGKSGRNASALRTLLFCAASLENVKVRLNIVTGEKGEDK